MIGSWLPFWPGGPTADAQDCVMGLHAVCSTANRASAHVAEETTQAFWGREVISVSKYIHRMRQPCFDTVR